ncbi:MAG: DinB family protein [Saprospiraceae bacterium]
MNAKQGTILLAAQMVGLLVNLNADVYTRPLPLFKGSTIGQHFRHILECYTCLLDGITSSRINYGSRKRNQALSENPKAALAVLDYIAHTVKPLEEHQELQVASEFSVEILSNSSKPEYASSLGRELQFAFDHAVHHLAMIRMGLEVYFPEIPLDDDLGIAPSTLKYRKAKTIERAIPETMYG